MGCAQRFTQGDFARALRATDQEKIRDVGAGDQEEESDGAQQNEQRRADTLGYVLEKGNHFGAPIQIAGWAFLGHLPGDERELFIGLLRGDAGLQACDGGERTARLPLAGAFTVMSEPLVLTGPPSVTRL